MDSTTINENAPQEDLGRILNDARIHRRLTLDEAAQTLHIRKEYLTALEHNEWEAIPGEVYGQGFLKSYARFLGLDGEDLVARRRRLIGQPEAAPVNPLQQTPPVAGTGMYAGTESASFHTASSALSPRRRKNPAQASSARHTAAAMESRAAKTRVGWIVGTLAALSIAGIFLHGNKPAAPATVVPQTHGPTPVKKKKVAHKTVHRAPVKKKAAPSVHTHHHAAPVQAQPLKVTEVSNSTSTSGYAVVYDVNRQPVTISLTFSGPCWIEDGINGTVANPYGHTYEAGQSVSFTGTQSVYVKIGSHAAALSVNGQPMALPVSQYVLNLTFNAQNAGAASRS
ncbi:MAG: helix-turn-helix domain-containing protein [Firmicutes bacterium]|nr:helix-turn-helix domain-containing protein [Bacillota bacterium]